MNGEQPKYLCDVCCVGYYLPSGRCDTCDIVRGYRAENERLRSENEKLTAATQRIAELQAENFRLHEELKQLDTAVENARLRDEIFLLKNSISSNELHLKLTLEAENANLRESLPLRDNRTRDAARNLLNETERFAVLPGGVEELWIRFHTAREVVEDLIAQNTQLIKDCERLKGGRNS